MACATDVSATTESVVRNQIVPQQKTKGGGRVSQIRDTRRAELLLLWSQWEQPVNACVVDVRFSCEMKMLPTAPTHARYEGVCSNH